MYTLANEREKLINQLKHEELHFDGEFLEPVLECYANAAKDLFTKTMHTKCDAGENVFLARQLLYMTNKQVNQLFTENKALSFIPVDTSIPVGAAMFSVETYTQVGSAAFVTNYGKDFPSADVYRTETTHKMFDIGSSYRYSLDDLRRAAFGGVPLSSKRADASRLAHDKMIDEIGLSGNSARGLTGLANNANVTVLTAGGGTITGGWETATVAQIKADLAAMESASVFACAGQSQLIADTLLLDDESYMILNTRPATTFSDRSILKSYLENSPYIKNIGSWVHLRNAGPSSVRRAIMYKRSPDILDIKISNSYETFAPQQQMLEWVVPALSRLSGVIFYRPFGCLYADGLSTSTPAGL